MSLGEPGRPRPGPGASHWPASARAENTRLYACVYAPEFPAQALLRLRPHLRRQCVAVLQGTPPHEEVCAANARARRDGLRNGMTRVEAESFGGMVLLARSSGEEARAHAALEACVSGFAPAAEPCHTDTAAMCVLDVSGMGRLHASPDAFASALRGALRQRGVYASIAVCGNFHAARVLAVGREGITVVPPGGERDALAPLLLPVLGLGEELETLALWGVSTLGGLAALPLRDLVARMGQAGRSLHELARGEHPHLFAPAPPAWELREELEFDAPVRVFESILFVLAAMLDQLIAQARERVLALATVTVRLRLGARVLDAEDDGRSEPTPQAPTGKHAASGNGRVHRIAAFAGRTHKDAHAPKPEQARMQGLSEAQASSGRMHQRTVRPTVPTQNKRLLLKLLQLDLQAYPPEAPVLAVVLEATAAKTGAVQAGLFAPPLPEPSRLDVTLARLTALVGEGRVGAPALRDTHAPDSFTVGAFRNEPAQSAEGSANAPALRQLRPPEPVTVYTKGGEPKRFSFRGELFHVHSACGPWRASGAWWGPECWAHECWDIVAVPAPAAAPWLFTVPPAFLCCRLRLDLQARQWRMEGVYD